MPTIVKAVPGLELGSGNSVQASHMGNLEGAQELKCCVRVCIWGELMSGGKTGSWIRVLWCGHQATQPLGFIFLPSLERERHLPFIVRSTPGLSQYLAAQHRSPRCRAAGLGYLHRFLRCISRALDGRWSNVTWTESGYAGVSLDLFRNFKKNLILW